MRLTKQSIASLGLPAGKAEFVAWDDTLPGFGVRLRQGRRATYFAQFRVNGRTQKRSLGYVGVTTLEEARQTARDLLHAARHGHDPKAAKAEARSKAALTVGAVADRYLKHAQTRLKARSFEEVERHLQKHWRPLGALPATSLKRSDIAARLQEIAASSGPTASNRARAALSAMFGWAVASGIVEQNPAIGTIRVAEEVSRDHVLRDDELAAIWRACRDDDYGHIIRILILTGQRREEVGSMAWAEVDTATALWTVPRARSKNDLGHEVPLSSLALAILTARPRQRDREFVFGTGSGGFSGWSAAKSRLDARIARVDTLVRPWRLHDLRRTMATRMADELRVPPHVIEAVLNHRSGVVSGVAAIYNRATYRPEKRDALDRWAVRLSNLVGSQL
jgi:integrase